MFMEILEELERIKDKVVIVEGKNDKRSLEELGFTRVVTIDRPLFEIVESIEDEVVILTDLDSEGKRLFSILRRDFERRGVKVDKKIRELLFRTRLRQIEGLNSYIKRQL